MNEADVKYQQVLKEKDRARKNFAGDVENDGSEIKRSRGAMELRVQQAVNEQQAQAKSFEEAQKNREKYYENELERRQRQHAEDFDSLRAEYSQYKLDAENRLREALFERRKLRRYQSALNQHERALERSKTEMREAYDELRAQYASIASAEKKVMEANYDALLAKYDNETREHKVELQKLGEKTFC